MHMDPITGFFAILISILAICSMFAVIGIKKRLDEQINLQRDMLASVFTLETIAKRLYPLESDHNESLNENLGALNVENIKKEIRGMHLTQPHTTCSLCAWQSIPEQSWSLSKVFRQTKPAFNTCFTCGGHPGFLVSGAVITKHGICRGTCTFVPVAGFRSLSRW